ncbi:MAG: MMPL family transporter [Paludibacter sp.]
MKKSLFIIRYRWWIIIATVLSVLVCIIPLTQIRINPDLETYMPDSMPSKQNNKLISDVFGKEEPILILLESKDVLNPGTLTRIENISQEFSRISEFSRVFSLFQTKNIRSEEGNMVVDPVIKSIPVTTADREKLRSAIKTNDLAYKLVVSDDFHYALIMLSSNKSKNDVALMQDIHQTLKKFSGPEKEYMTGQPYLRDEANKKISRDLMLLLPIGLILMFIFLWVSFRELSSVLLPFSVVVFSIIFCMALIPLLGWQLSLIGILIPIMMIAIANNYGVYFIAKYQDLNATEPNLSMIKIVEKSARYLYTPIILCGLTTIVGTLGLVLHLLLPASQMGVVSAIGIAFALLVSLLFVPAVLSLLKKGKPHKDLVEEKHGFFGVLLFRTGKLVTHHPRRIVLFFISFFILSTLGFIYFRVAPDSNKVMPKHHEFNEAIDIVNRHFGGNKMINVMFEGDIKDPRLLEKLDKYQTELEKLPNVGSVTSLATIIKKMSTALNDSSDQGYNKIPPSREAVAQYLELYSMNGDPKDLEQFVNFDFSKTLMTIQYQAQNMSDINMVLNKLDDLGKTDPIPHIVGGYSLVDKEISDSVVSGQIYSLLFALVAIFILLSLIFKSITAGLLGSLPLVFAVSCTFGLMGWLGIELNIVTALLSSISIGLGVDFTIHVFWRMKWELARGKSYSAGVMGTLKSIGRGISINAFSVMLGFSVLFISAFPIIQSFAFLIIISLFLCLICALVLIPALCMIIKPRFLTINKTTPKPPKKALKSEIT